MFLIYFAELPSVITKEDSALCYIDEGEQVYLIYRIE